ncbi:MAG TPA: hypothetical protein VES20_12850, partial [Bryobacteraceae bacterium]|nr:hypothetical protein [Bryobacteraceae bacterium]
PLVLTSEREVRPALPLRLIGLGARSGYSTALLGLRPFDITSVPVDRIRAHIVRARTTTRRWLPMNAPEAEEHILSGIYQLEGDTRWMSRRAVLALARPANPRPMEVQLYLPAQASARQVSVSVDGEEVLRQQVRADGVHTLTTRPVSGSTVVVELDQTFRVAGDNRDLGAVLISAGYR